MRTVLDFVGFGCYAGMLTGLAATCAWFVVKTGSLPVLSGTGLPIMIIAIVSFSCGVIGMFAGLIVGTALYAARAFRARRR